MRKSKKTLLCRASPGFPYEGRRHGGHVPLLTEIHDIFYVGIKISQFLAFPNKEAEIGGKIQIWGTWFWVPGVAVAPPKKKTDGWIRQCYSVHIW